MASHDYLKKSHCARPTSRSRRNSNPPATCRPACATPHLKREDNQPVFVRCARAYNKMAHIPSEALRARRDYASAGNHAQGVAFSAARMGVRP